MTAVYLLFTILSLFACMLPVGVFSVIWEQVTSNMTVGVPYIAIIRMLIAAGVIIAVVLSDRIRAYEVTRDIVIGSTALEALSLLGFSLSRVFWNLCVWSVCLGFGLGMGVSLLCRMLRRYGGRYTEIVFAGGAGGILAGAWILSQVLARGGGWRTSCQILAVVQVLLCLLQFSLRRRRLRDSVETLRKMKREKNRERSDRRQKRIRNEGEVDERSAPAYFRKLTCCYLSSTLCSLLIFGTVLWPEAYLVSSGGGTISSVRAIMTVCAGLAAVRLASGLIPVSGRKKALLFGVFTVAVTGIAAALTRFGTTVFQLELLQFAAGFGTGPILPNLIAIEDERLDEEAQDSLFGLLPAFYFGSWALITPLTQALVGSSGEDMFALWLLVIAAVMTICLAGAGKQVKR